MSRYYITLFIGILISCNHSLISICVQNLKIGNGLTFHPKSSQILISKPTAQKDKNNKNQYSLFEVAPTKGKDYFSKALKINSEYSDYHPVFSSKGDFILFNSTRPKPNGTTSNGKVDIYYSRIENNQFTEPQYLNTINTEYHDSYPTLTNTNKLYFNSDRPGGKGMMDIYVSEYKNSGWQTPVLIPELNSVHSENDLVVDPQERFIIFNRYVAETNEIDLFISYNRNGSWTKPKPMQNINEPKVWELTPTLSLDGKTLYLEINGKVECHKLTH